jgi:hypothetical protein
MRMLDSASAVPGTDEEFIRQYRGYVIGLVRRAGIAPQDAEDVADEILLAELTARNHQKEEVGIRALYDPEHTAEHQGVTQRVSFRAFLSHRVMLRVRGKGDSIRKRAAREPLLCDAQVEDGVPWIEVFGGQCWDDYPDLDAAEFVRRMRSHLASVPPPEGSCDLLALFDELCREVREEGDVSAASVGSHFQVSDTVAAAWLARLREVMSAAGEHLPVPEKHVISGVVLSPADLREAITILREARGIMVRQPLARAGHPLARAEDPGWYHALAAAERRAYPHLEVDPQTHRRPAGHVKLAVIHRLERMLGVAMADAEAQAELAAVPEEEPTVLDEIEASLWQLGAGPEQVTSILGLVEQYANPVTAA